MALCIIFFTVFNNIIPYKTGASSSIINVMPNMKGKIQGTCIRVPVSNCSDAKLAFSIEFVQT